MRATLSMLLDLLAFAGLVKPKKYDWKDSNLAMFGSDREKQVKSKTRIDEFINSYNCN